MANDEDNDKAAHDEAAAAKKKERAEKAKTTCTLAGIPASPFKGELPVTVRAPVAALKP